MKTLSRGRSLIAVCLHISLLLSLTPLATIAQQTAPQRFELTVDNIMRGPNLVGYPPTEVRWSQDGRRIYFRWKRAGEPRLKEADLYVVDRDGRGLHKLSEEEARRAPPAAGELSKDKKLTVFTEDGDVYIYEHAKDARRQITRTTETESNAHFTQDQRHIYFTRQNNLYVLALDGGSLTQLTDIRTGGASDQSGSRSIGSASSGEGSDGKEQQRGTTSQELLKKEERDLLEAVRERAVRREEQEAKRKQREKRRQFQIPAGQSLINLTLAPDGAHVVATINQPATGAKNAVVPSYVTETAYTETIPSRPKVGDTQGRTRLAVVATETGDLRWVEHSQRVDAAPRVQVRTEGNATEQAQREQGTATQQNQARQQTGGSQQSQTETLLQQNQTGQRQGSENQSGNREVQLFSLVWSDDGRRAVMLARSSDNKDRWVLMLDPATGKTRTLAGIHDESWVGGPGASTLGWLPDNRTVYFQSEQSGYSHLYTVSTEGGEPRQLTEGRFEVFDVNLSKDKTKFYFTSSETHFGERHLYSMSIKGGPRTRLTSMPGNNQADLSPDETMLVVVRSYSNKPPELYLAANKPEAEAIQITTSPVPDFFSYNWIDPPIIDFKARDGQTVHARLYKPANFQKGGPAVVFVHGAGYLQNVHRWWSQYFREYMFHHLLMERGYTVIDVDYRGSAGYGRDWRTGIYRHMGGKDLSDHVDAARYLVSEHGVDSKRVGIYGGSYGGFITFMAMFTEADVFAAGAALRPVTDWAHYNHPYTSNILNLPQSDMEAYKRSSPIYHAAGLKGALLICHGMVDTNVHFQDTVRLVQRLIELRKENWELAVYPVEDHAFEQPSSWADEYKRILKLFELNLRLRGAAESSAAR